MSKTRRLIRWIWGKIVWFLRKILAEPTDDWDQR